VKDVGEPDEGEPHVRFDGGELEKERATDTDYGSPSERTGLELRRYLQPVSSPAPHPSVPVTFLVIGHLDEPLPAQSPDRGIEPTIRR
jgi:hypothetical protein